MKRHIFIDIDAGCRSLRFGIEGSHLALYLWGLSLYVPWRWWPTVQVGQIDKNGWPKWGTRRIGPMYRTAWGPGVYVCYYWPE